MMNKTFNIEIIHWQKASRRPNCLLSPTGKKVRHVHAFYSIIDINKIANLSINFRFNDGLLGLWNRKNARVGISLLSIA